MPHTTQWNRIISFYCDRWQKTAEDIIHVWTGHKAPSWMTCTANKKLKAFILEWVETTYQRVYIRSTTGPSQLLQKRKAPDHSWLMNRSCCWLLKHYFHSFIPQFFSTYSAGSTPLSDTWHQSDWHKEKQTWIRACKACQNNVAVCIDQFVSYARLSDSFQQ